MTTPTDQFERYRHLRSVGHARDWLLMRARFGLAPNTIDAYARSLDSYFSFAASTEIDPETSTRADVARWVRDLETRGLANATLIQRITALRLYFEYLVEEGLRPSSPVLRGGAIQAYGSAIFRTRGPVRRLHKLPWIPTDEQWQRVLDATSDASLRNRTMLALAYDGALRREELCRVAVSDFDFARKLLTFRAETTKTKRGRVVPYSCWAATSIDGIP
jgi:integrase/recombinase XerD